MLKAGGRATTILFPPKRKKNALSLNYLYQSTCKLLTGLQACAWPSCVRQEGYNAAMYNEVVWPITGAYR